MRLLPWGEPAPAYSPEEVARLEHRDRALGVEPVRVVSPLARMSALAGRVQEITGLPAQLLQSTEGGWMAVALVGEGERVVWGETRVEALSGLVSRLEARL